MGKDRRNEHVVTAAAAGLDYVTDAMPGIRRKRWGRGFSYYGPDGEPMRDRKEVRRIKAMVIPPAWTEVWICPNPNGHLQVTARDSKGRKQYRYHPRFREARDETKFGRILAFSESLPRIRQRVERDLSLSGLPREKVLATVVWLLERTLFRVGNTEYAKDNLSFGLTTLQDHHVEVSGSELRFEFRGKSGVVGTAAITDSRIAEIVQKCRELPGEQLFQYLDDDGQRQVVDSGDINDYLREIGDRDITAKDFRTWAGTMLAALALRQLGPSPTERKAKSNVVRAIDQVAERLGNTRAVCRKYYVHPAILDAYLGGRVLDTLPEPARSSGDQERRERPSGALRRAETAVLEFLQEELRRGDTAFTPPSPRTP